MRIFILIGIWQGCLNDVEAYTDRREAREARARLLKEYDLTDEDEGGDGHSNLCRWDDENEVHIHAITLRGKKEVRT